MCTYINYMIYTDHFNSAVLLGIHFLFLRWESETRTLTFLMWFNIFGQNIFWSSPMSWDWTLSIIYRNLPSISVCFKYIMIGFYPSISMTHQHRLSSNTFDCIIEVHATVINDAFLYVWNLIYFIVDENSQFKFFFFFWKCIVDLSIIINGIVH